MPDVTHDGRNPPEGLVPRNPLPAPISGSAINLLACCSGHVVVSDMGKGGIMARKGAQL